MMDEMERRRIFSNNLKYYINLSKKTQKQIAEETGIAPQTLNNWINMISIPKMGKISLLASYFHVNYTDLIEERRTNNQEHYYLDEQSREMAQWLFDNPEYKVLFDASRNVKPEDIQFVKDFIDRISNK